MAVKDADTGEIIFSSSFNVDANDRTVIGNIAEKNKQAMWLVDYSAGNEKFTNHYLNGSPPFKLEDYLRWFNKLEIKETGSFF